MYKRQDIYNKDLGNYKTVSKYISLKECDGYTVPEGLQGNYRIVSDYFKFGIHDFFTSIDDSGLGIAGISYYIVVQVLFLLASLVLSLLFFTLFRNMLLAFWNFFFLVVFGSVLIVFPSWVLFTCGISLAVATGLFFIRMFSTGGGTDE